MRRKTVAVFGSSQTVPGSSEWADAHTVGATLAAEGYDVLTGGYGGTMEAVSLGAAEAGAGVIGVTAPAIFPGRSAANPHVSQIVEAATLAGRIDEMIRRSDGALALPGSIGTAAELLICWNINHIVRRNGGAAYPAAAIGEVWRHLGVVLADEAEAVLSDIHWAPTPELAVEWLTSALRMS